MSMADFYPWVKALHVAAIVTFMASLLAASLFLAACRDLNGQPAATWTGAARIFRRWDQAVTTPALLAVWLLGMTLASTGEWFQDGWLQAKLVLVLAISAIHGIQSKALRRMADGEVPGSERVLRVAGPLALAMVTAIAILAVVKPF